MDLSEARANAGKSVLAAEVRRRSIAALLHDLEATESSSKKSSHKESPAALSNLQALKFLGRSPDGSEELASRSGLDVLCSYAQLKDAPNAGSPTEARLEAWRTLCNTLKLHGHAASEVEGMDHIVEHATAIISINIPSLQFLSARLLFLLTIKGSEINRTLIEKLGAILYIHDALQAYCDALDSSQPGKTLTAEEQMALSEILKFLYNLVIFFPRLQALDPKSETDAQEAAHEPLARSTSSSGASSSPDPPASGNSGGGDSPTASLSSSPKSSATALGRGIRNIMSLSTSSKGSRPGSPVASAGSKRAAAAPKNLDYLSPLLIHFLLLLPYDPAQPFSGSPLGGALLCLGELPCAKAWFAEHQVREFARVSDSQLPSTSTTSQQEAPGTLSALPAKLLFILDSSTAYCFPGNVDPDDAGNRDRFQNLGRSLVDLDAELAPLLLLLRKCVVGDSHGQTQSVLKARLLSKDIDRSDRLDKRGDLTGRLIRLMNSVYYSNTKVGAGELLFAICGQNADALIGQLGYGLAAGFLMSNGMMSAPASPAPGTDFASAARPVNPVTGVYEPENPGPSPREQMTPEEQEREAEKLYVLFERLKKTGVMDVKNPVEEAQQSGRFEELSEEEDAQTKADRLQQEDEREQKEAEEEMASWKSRSKPKGP